jgi:hypothetical protein
MMHARQPRRVIQPRGEVRLPPGRLPNADYGSDDAS